MPKFKSLASVGPMGGISMATDKTWLLINANHKIGVIKWDNRAAGIAG